MAGNTIEHVLRIQAEQAEASLKGVATEAKKTEAALENVGESAEHVEDKAGRADSILQGLAGALELVSPAAADAVRSLGDMSGGLEAIARLGGSALAILGPVAVAVGVLGLAYKKLAGDLKEAEERQRAANDAATEAVRINQRLNASLAPIELQAQLGRGEISEEQFRQSLANLQAEAVFADAAAGARERLTAATAGYNTVAAKSAQLAAMEANLRGEGPAAGDVTLIPALRREVAQLTNEYNAAAAAVAGFDERIAETAQDILDGADALQNLGASAGAAAAEGVAVLTEQVEELSAAVATFQSLGGLGLEGVTGSTSGTIDAATRARLGVSGTVRYDPAEDRSTNPVFSGSSAGAGQALGLLAGNPAGALAALGPAGLALGGLAGIGAAGGAAGVKGKLSGFGDDIITGLKELPAILGDVLPEFISEFIAELFAALPEALPTLIKASIEGQLEVAKYLLTELPGVLLDAGVQMILTAWETIKEFFGGLRGDPDKSFGQKAGNTALDIGRVGLAIGTAGLSEWVLGKLFKDGVPRFDVGTSMRGVDKTGLALVHQGERIVRSGGGGANSDIAGGTPVTVNISAAAIDRDVIPRLVEEIRYAIGATGRGVEALP